MTFDIKAVKARAEAKRAEHTQTQETQPEAVVVELAPAVIRTKAEAALIDLNATKRGNKNVRKTLSYTSHAARSVELVAEIFDTDRYETSLFAALGADIEILNRLRLLALDNSDLKKIFIELEDRMDYEDRIFKNLADKELART
ncbi:hypothetical protein [Pseudomonas saxonica]|uniref:Uncharacterized protein n=1 Tax=Pseudomonas saxonica TaxID=2600598 RepID=A0A5C5PZ44_9PSED|nr:hypothetical protein [Pseudomonas saxonica]TWR96384.1 hypothetical protein FJD37_08645 [Pseudomonas saxonica]